MKTGNIIKEKSYAFSLKIISVYQELTLDKREFILSKQLLRSATSIGANVEEAIGGQSKNDFIAKMSISYKEARETHYWLNLLTDSGFLKREQSVTLIHDCEEILKILATIIRVSKESTK
jgi:four helix bundle protein